MLILEMRYRSNRKVGNPATAVIFLTCLFFPSLRISLIQESGIFFRNRIGGFLSGTGGASGKDSAFAFRVSYFFPSSEMVTPFLRASSASGVMLPSTCTQYSLSCAKEG